MTDMDHIERLLAAERAVLPPANKAPVELERLFQAMATHAAPMPVAAGSLKLGWALVTKWIGIGFIIGTAGAGAASYGFSSDARQGAAALPARAHATAAPTASSAIPALAAPVAAPPASNGLVIVHGSKPIPTRVDPNPQPSPSTVSTFDEELKVITAAKRELDAGKAHLARVWLDEHRQRFPRGVFSLEREGLAMLVTCATRQNPALARDFARQHPDSPMLQQVLRRCGVQGMTAPAQSAGSFLAPDK